MQATTASYSQKQGFASIALAVALFLAPQMVQAAETQAELAGVDVHKVAKAHVAPAQAEPFPIIHVGNFERVSSTLMRGAAPSAQALKRLKDAGVKTIVNLRGEGAGSQKEERAARAVGLDYYNIPMGFTEPNLSKVSSVLDIIRDPQKQPVYVHCLQGADRTGMIVGIHRVLSDGWEFDKAYSEMRGHHFKAFLIPMRRTVQAFANGRYTYVERQGVSIAGVTSKPASARIATDKAL